MKKMIVNCATCDMRRVSEETLQAYEQIVVNGQRCVHWYGCLCVR